MEPFEREEADKKTQHLPKKYINWLCQRKSSSYSNRNHPNTTTKGFKEIEFIPAFVFL